MTKVDKKDWSRTSGNCMLEDEAPSDPKFNGIRIKSSELKYLYE